MRGGIQAAAVGGHDVTGFLTRGLVCPWPQAPWRPGLGDHERVGFTAAPHEDEARAPGGLSLTLGLYRSLSHSFAGPLSCGG